MTSSARQLLPCLLCTLALGCTPPAPKSAPAGGDGPSAAAPVPSTPAPASVPVPAPDAPREQVGLTPGAQPSPAKPDEKAGPAAVADPVKPSAPLSPECEALWKQIQELDARLPLVYVGLKRSLDEINKDMVSIVELARRFLASCPGTAPQCDVKAALVRSLHARHRRYQEEIKTQGLAEGDIRLKHSQYLEDVQRQAEEVAGECPRGSRARITALRVLVDLHELRGEYDKLRALAAQIIEEMPSFEGRPGLHLAVTQSYLNERKYAEAVKYLDEVIKMHPGDAEYVAYIEKLFDALTGVGDLERMEEVVELIRAEYPERVKEMPPDSHLRGYYDTWLCISPFWMGFIKMAFGEMPEARRYFQEQIDAADALQKQVKPDGPIQSNVCLIFRDMRSSDLLYWIDNHHGKAPGLEIPSAITWASDQKVAPSDLQGKVVAILGRMPENRRSETFLQELDQLVQSHGKDGLVAMTLGYLAGAENPAADAQLLEKLREDLKRLKVSIPAGFETDRAGHKLFRGLHLTVGTPSFVLLDRQGRQAWILADPRDMDRALARRVIERLLSEKPEAPKGAPSGGAK